MPQPPVEQGGAAVHEAWELRLTSPTAAAARAEEALEAGADSRTRIVAFATIATARLALDDPEAALAAATTSCRLADEHADPDCVQLGEVVTEACLVALRSTFLLGDAVAALRWGGEGLQLAQRHGLPLLASRAYNDLAAVYGSRGLLDVSVKYLNAGIAVLEEAGEPVSPALLNNLGNVYLDTFRLDEALGCFVRAREGFLEREDRFGAAIARSNEGRALGKAGSHAEAALALEEALSWFAEIENERYRSTTMAKLAEVFAGARDVARAEELYVEALQGSVARKDSFEAEIRASYGEFLLAENRHAAALVELRRAAELFNEVGNSVSAATVFQPIASALAALGRFEEAYRQLEAAVEEQRGSEADRSTQVLGMLLAQLEMGLGDAHELNVVARQAVVDANNRLREQTAQLELLSTTDDLTGLRNRRYLRQRLEERTLQAQRDGEDLALVLIDVDRFKAVNDRFSHAVGDVVLVRVGELLGRAFRTSDVLSRWGGEEYMILVSGSGKEEAAAAADRARALVATHDWDEVAPGLRVTLSAGVAALSEVQGAAGLDAVSELVRVVDGRLYAAKGAGRNRTRA